ncbi:MAG: hypothetical protein L6V85_04210 [Clostridiales bacterium]|nr:MAG: hypothetical protein L6V85_04210 [Clostridiales bacterium]
MELTQIEALLKKLEVPKRIADSTLKAYAETQGQINELKKAKRAVYRKKGH